MFRALDVNICDRNDFDVAVVVLVIVQDCFHCFCDYLYIVALLIYSQRYEFMSAVMTCKLTVPHENQWYGAQRPKKSMAKYECEPPVFDLVLSFN